MTDEMRLGLEQARLAYEAEKERRATPEAREERVRSRTAHEGLGLADALALGKLEFAGVFAAPAFEPMRLPEGARIERLIDDGGAVIEDGGRYQLVESIGTPLTSRLGSGEREFVDLSLRAIEGGFEPVNPVVPVRITGQGGAVLSEQGISVALESDAAGDGPLETNGRVFFANSLPDTDLVVEPKAGGVSFAFQVRSAAAPERAVLAFDLPAGARLRGGAGADGRAVDIIDSDGAAFARVLPPAGWDADGEALDVTYAVEGARLEARFPHRDEDLRYPLYVDPVVYSDGWDDTSDGWPEWGFYANANVWNSPSTPGDPLKLANQGNSSTPVWYWQNEFASYSVWPLRGYISKLEGLSVAHNSSQVTCAYMGILADQWAYWKSAWSHCYDQSAPTNFPVASNADTNYRDWAMFQFKIAVSGNRWGEGSLTASGIRVYLEDKESPTVTNPASVPNSTNGNWVGPNTQVTVNPSAIDQGLGMRAFNLYEAGTPTSWVRSNGEPTSDINAACKGMRGYRCPNDRAVTGAVTFNTSNLSASGVRNIHGGAFDALSKQTGYGTLVRYDNTPPTATLAGELWDLRGAASIMPGNYQLEVSADDSESGVASVQGFVNTGSGWNAAGFADQRLDGSQRYVWTFRGGAHASSSDYREVQIRIAVADRVGNVRWMPDFSVSLYPNKPEKLGLPEERLYAYGIGDHQVPWHVDPFTSNTTSWDPRMLEDIQANQLGFIRVAFNADHSNFNTPGASWNFTAYDTIVREAARKRLQVLPILINQVPNPLAPGKLLSKPPQSDSERENFANWAGAVARRYGPRYDPANRGTFWADPANADLHYRPILAWEIWNEPNSQQDHLKFGPADGDPDAAGYADLLARVEAAFRGSTSMAQPNARIVFGGLTVSDRVAVPYLTFLDSVINAGGKGHFDAVAIHPYAKDDIAAHQLIKDLRDFLNHQKRKLGTVQIWPNEIAWSVEDPADPRFNAGTKEQQAFYLEMLLYTLEAQRGTLNLGPIAWFPLHDVEPREFWGHRAGLKDFSGNEISGVGDYPPAPTPAHPVRWNGPNRPALNTLRLYAYLEDAIPLPAMH